MKIVGDCTMRGFHEHASKRRLFNGALNTIFSDAHIRVVDLRGQGSRPVPAGTVDERPLYSSVVAQCLSPAGVGILAPAAGPASPTGPSVAEEIGTQDPDRDSVNQPPLAPATIVEDTASPTGPSMLEVRTQHPGHVTTNRHPPAPAATEEDSAMTTGFSGSRLRNVSVKMEKARSHCQFLSTCIDEGLIPKGFILKWKCHLVDSNATTSILRRTSSQLMEACRFLAEEKFASLSEDFQRGWQILSTQLSAEDLSELSAQLARDRARTRKNLDRSKGGETRSTPSGEHQPIQLQVQHRLRRGDVSSATGIAYP